MALTKPGTGDPFGTGPTRSTNIVGAVIDWINQHPVNVREAAYNADATGATDAHGALATAVSAAGSGGCVEIPPGIYRMDSPLVLSAPVTIIGGGASSDRWRGPRPTQIDYRGSGQAFLIQSPSGVLDSVTLRGLSVNGANAASSTDGLVIDQGSGVAVEGVLIDDCSFTNFSRYQVSHTGLVFDVTYRRLNANDKDRTGDNVVNIASAAGGPGQITFNDCFLIGYGAAKWIVYSAGPNMRFIGGTVAAGNGTGVNGIRGPFTLTLTHVEGVSNLGVGLRRVTSLGGVVFPELLNTWATGLQIGDPGNGSAAAQGTIIGGAIGNNTTDIHIVAGGTRAGTLILPLGRVSGAPVITNDRETTDSVRNEVVYFHNDAGTLDLRGTDFVRLRAGGGTTLVAGDFAISAGWGTTASVSAVAGKDSRFQITVSSAGTGQGANPTVTLTFKDGTWGSTAPYIVANRADTNAPTAGFWAVTSRNPTNVGLTFVGTPVAGTDYKLEAVVVG